MRRLAILLVLAAGCADGKSIVTLTVDAAQGSSLSGVDHLVVKPADDAGKMDAVIVPCNPVIPPAVVFSLRFDAGVSGHVHIDVDAVDSMGVSQGQGFTDVTVAPSKTLTAAVSLAQVIHPPEGSTLSFAVQPSDVAVASAIKPAVQVSVLDKNGLLVTSTNIPITLAVGAGPGKLSGTLTVAAAAGIASFADLEIDTISDGYTLTASSGTLSVATSNPFKVTAPAWLPASIGLYGASVSTLVLDPKHPATVYAGTKDSEVWKTIDAAATWTTANAGLPRKPVNGLAIDPVTTSTLYASTDSGMYKSTNSGATWSAINNGPAGMATDPFFGVAVDPAHPSYVFAGHFGPKVYRTVDGGANWTDVSTGITAYGPQTKSLAFHPFDGTVYAATYGSGLYRMAYNGTTWTAVGGAPLTGTGHYLNAVAFDPGNSQVVYVGGEVSGVLYRTQDSGGTWAPIASPPADVHALAAFAPVGGGATRWYVGLAAGSPGVETAPDGITFSQNLGISEAVRSLAVDPVNAGVAYAATATGIYKTSNGFNWAISVNGMTGNPVNALAIDPKSPTNLYAGLENAGLYRSTDGATSWSPPATAGNIPPAQRVTDLAVDTIDPMQIWASTSGGAWKSTNRGTSWVDGALGTPAVSIAGAPGTSGTFYAGANANAFVITAATWMPAGSGLPAAVDATGLAVHPGNAMIVYAATGAGVYRTANGGASWTAATNGMGAVVVNAIAIDPVTPNNLWAGTATGLSRSTDGMSWVGATGLPADAVTAVAVSKTKPNIVFAGTLSSGVFRSADGGASFTADSAGLGSLAVTRLVVDPSNENVAYVGTWDGGMFKTAP